MRVNKTWLALGIVAALSACGSDGGSNDGDNDTGGQGSGGTTGDGGTTGSGGNTTGGGGNTTGGGGNTTGGGSTTGGTTGADLPDAAMCGAQSGGKPLDTSAMGGCYYFYCYLTEAELKSMTSTGACTNDKDIALQCKGDPVKTVSECARTNAGVAIQGEAAFKKAVADCARKNTAIKDFSDGCLNCNVDSSWCAASKCLTQCVTGDSPNCDKCRQDNGCTPTFYKCGGLPDPKM